MDWSDIASMIAALAFAVFVLATAYPLIQLGRTFRKTAQSVDRLTASAAETINETTKAVREAGAQMAKVDDVTTSVSNVAQDVSAMTTLVAATVGSPLIKLNALSHSTRALLSRQIGVKEVSAAYRGRQAELRAALMEETPSTMER